MKTMEFSLFDLGLIDFKRAWLLQQELFNRVKTGDLQSALILCQHYPVITLGRSAKKENILASEQKLLNMGIPVYETERGGDVTYHGPGQIIAYPIFNLALFKKDIHLFLRQMEGIAIDLLSVFGVKGIRNPGLTGVWVNFSTDDLEKDCAFHVEKHIKKIASIGIAIRNWITFHGLSINIKKVDLSKFGLIKPCGMEIEVTSLETLLGHDVEIALIKKILIQKFNIFFLKKS